MVAVDTIRSATLEGHLKIRESSVDIIFLLFVLIWLGNIGLKSDLELQKVRGKVVMQFSLRCDGRETR